MIYSAFPGTGKTYASKQFTKIIDLESSNYQWEDDLSDNVELNKGRHKIKNKEWPDNYVQAMIDSSAGNNNILISAQPIVLDKLTYNKIGFITVTPDIRDCSAYINRYIQRGNSSKFIDNIAANFENYVNDMDHNMGAAYHIKLGRHMFISDYFYSLIDISC